MLGTAEVRGEMRYGGGLESPLQILILASTELGYFHGLQSEKSFKIMK